MTDLIIYPDIAQAITNLTDMLTYYIQHEEDRNFAIELTNSLALLAQGALLERNKAIEDLEYLEAELDDFASSNDNRVSKAREQFRDEVYDDGFEEGFSAGEESAADDPYMFYEATESALESVREDIETELGNYLTHHEASLLTEALMNPHWLHNNEEAQSILKKLYQEVSGNE